MILWSRVIESAPPGFVDEGAESLVDRTENPVFETPPEHAVSRA